MTSTENLQKRIVPPGYKAGVTRSDLFREIAVGLVASVGAIAVTGSIISVNFDSHFALPKKPVKVALCLLLAGSGLVSIESGSRLNKKLLKYTKAGEAEISGIDMGFEDGLNNMQSEASVARLIKTIHSFIPAIGEIQKLNNAGLPWAYIAAIAKGSGTETPLDGILRLEAMKEAQQEQIRIEQTFNQSQEQTQQQTIEVAPVIPENAQRILRVASLPKLQLPLQYQETAIAPNVVREVFTLPAGVDKLPALENELSLEFGKSVFSGIHGAGKVFIEIPRQDREYPQMPERNWEQGGAKVVLGTNTKGEVEFDLTNEVNPHFLIGGTTGGGKTFSVLRPMVYSLLRQGCEVIVVGGKRFDYEDLINKHGLKFYDNEYAHVWAADFARECSELRKGSAEQINATQRRVLVIDEYSATVMATMSEAQRIASESEEELDPKKLSKQMVEEYDRNLSEVARIGRALKRHLIIATQRVALRGTNDPDGIPHVVRANLPARIALKCVSSNEGNLILPNGGDRAVGLLGRGDAIAMAGSLNERFQGYAVPTSK